jgi:integration host factor subunit alpha
MSKTVIRADIIDAIYREVGLSYAEASTCFETVVDKISEALVKEGEVKISGFATFTVRSKKARVGRNPKTGKEAVITPRKVISFYPSKKLKDTVNT